ncbi:MAG: NAD-dependent epimerase/dehydratase family protein [Nitrospina sp.]|jgi:nucleoside-diphosphate-sugar epimerase|nr:NAD-dependent epimerase/dehydratase family protein [Nitrospina sp.]MBT5633445.1 NAD-dependent epimerase/dehydratase family protein [Nitrospina sp.]
MKFLITGASSSLASKLVAMLLQSGKFSFRLLEHRSSARIEKCETVSGDMNDPESLERACQGMDGVLHLAALTHSSDDAEYFRVNREGTKNLLAACKRNNVKRFIFISSVAASGEGGAYGLSKLESEELVCQSGLEWVIIRPSEVYGPQMKEGIGKLISWVENLQFVPVIGDGSHCLSPVYIDDVVEAMAQVMMNPGLISQKLNLCGPEIIPMKDLIDRLSRFLQVRRYKIFVPVWIAKLGVSLASSMAIGSFTPDQIPRLLCRKNQDINQTSTIISYSPQKLEEGLNRYL